MGMLDFYVRIIKALDEIGAPYMIVGAFGGTIFGITRATHDIDFIVDLREKDLEAFSQKFPLPRYYADPEMIKNSVEMGIRTIFLPCYFSACLDSAAIKFIWMRSPKKPPVLERRLSIYGTKPLQEQRKKLKREMRRADGNCASLIPIPYLCMQISSPLGRGPG